jgi:glycyl-tRNA synthetase alpha chain
VRQREEREFSKYSFEVADKGMLFDLFGLYEKECLRCLEAECVLPAYDYCLRCSHTFNLLDSRGAISVTERVGLIGRVRNLAVRVAASYVNNHEE